MQSPNTPPANWNYGIQNLNQASNQRLQRSGEIELVEKLKVSTESSITGINQGEIDKSIN